MPVAYGIMAGCLAIIFTHHGSALMSPVYRTAEDSDSIKNITDPGQWLACTNQSSRFLGAAAQAKDAYRQQRHPNLSNRRQLDLSGYVQRDRPQQSPEALSIVRDPPRLQDTFGKVDAVRIALEPEKQLLGGGGAVHEVRAQRLQAGEMVAMNMTEEARLYVLCVRTEAKVVN